MCACHLAPRTIVDKHLNGGQAQAIGLRAGAFRMEENSTTYTHTHTRTGMVGQHAHVAPVIRISFFSLIESNMCSINHRK